MTILQQAADALQGGTYSRAERDKLAVKLARLNSRDGFTLRHALEIAAERFEEDAKAFDELKAEPIEGENRMALFNPHAAERLAAQFRQQAADTRELIATLEDEEEEEIVAA